MKSIAITAVSFAYLAALIGSFFMGATAETYQAWVKYGILCSILLFAAIPVATILMLLGVWGKHNSDSESVITHLPSLKLEPPRVKPMNGAVFVAPLLLFVIAGFFLLIVLVVGLIWP